MKAGLALKPKETKSAPRSPRLAVDLDQVVKRLGVGPEWVESWVREGVLPAPSGSLSQQNRISEARQALSATPEPEKTRPAGRWQRFLDWFGWRQAIQQLEADNCRLMLQNLQAERELELLNERYQRLQASHEELRQQLEQQQALLQAEKLKNQAKKGSRGRRR